MAAPPPRDLARVTPDDRTRAARHGRACVWLTGLPAAGKSSLALGVERRLHDRGWRTFVLDGDELRTGLNAGLGFSPEARSENLRRAGHVARLMVDAGLVVLAAFVSPSAADRARVRAMFDAAHFVEVWVRCDVDVCRARDPKGLYARAARGELAGLTGVDAPYEPPAAADIVIATDALSLPAAIDELEARLVARLGATADPADRVVR
ncbi:MAG: adenylyl-sulfate kinase [Deltaproteobacteria bacterium]|nr:adenylyl-sulfate kinase [Deltaproteobacteria bacterium]